MNAAKWLALTVAMWGFGANLWAVALAAVLFVLAAVIEVTTS